MLTWIKKRSALSVSVSWQNLKRANHNIKAGNKSFESVREFRYLETTRADQNRVHLEVENRFKLGKPDITIRSRILVYNFSHIILVAMCVVVS